MHAKIHISGNRWSPCLPLGVDDDHRLVTLTSNTLERPQFDISLHDRVRKLAANQTLGVEDLKIAQGEAEPRKAQTSDPILGTFENRHSNAKTDLTNTVILCHNAQNHRQTCLPQCLQSRNCVLWVACHLVLGSIADESLGVCEGHIGWSGSVALIVGNDLHAIILPHTYHCWRVSLLESIHHSSTHQRNLAASNLTAHRIMIT